MISLDEVNKYLNSLFDYLILDNNSHLQFEIIDWTPAINIEELLPNTLLKSPIFNYRISMDGSTIKDKVELLEYTNQLSSEEEVKGLNIKITLTLKKSELINNFTNQTENTFVFFLLENFIAHVDTISNINNSKFLNLFIVDKNIKNASNDYIRIIPFENLFENQILDLSIRAIDKFRSTEKIFGDTKEIKNIFQLPNFWSIRSNDVLFQEFNHLYLLNTLHLIANKSDLNKKSFVIKGHYNLNLTIDLPATEINHLKLEELLEFTIDEDSNRHTERVLIVRNVLTNYLSFSSNGTELNEKLTQIVATIWHHFELYVQNEIKVFMDQKNKLLQESVALADKINQQNLKITEFFQKNVIIILGIVISNFIPLLKNINSVAFGLISSLTIVLISMLNLRSIEDSKKQLNNNICKFKFYVDNISNTNLDGLSIGELKKKFINQDKEVLESNLKLQENITWILIILAILFSIVLCIYNYPDFFPLNVTKEILFILN